MTAVKHNAGLLLVNTFSRQPVYIHFWPLYVLVGEQMSFVYHLAHF